MIVAFWWQFQCKSLVVSWLISCGAFLSESALIYKGARLFAGERCSLKLREDYRFPAGADSGEFKAPSNRFGSLPLFSGRPSNRFGSPPFFSGRPSNRFRSLPFFRDDLRIDSEALPFLRDGLRVDSEALPFFRDGLRIDLGAFSFFQDGFPPNLR